MATDKINVELEDGFGLGIKENERKMSINKFVNNKIVNQNINTLSVKNEYESSTDPYDFPNRESHSTITLNASHQQIYSDVSDTVQIIGKDQSTGYKRLSCFSFSPQRRKVAIVTIITVILIITASIVVGCFLNIYGREKITEVTVDETTTNISEPTTNISERITNISEATTNISEATTETPATEPDSYKFINRSEYNAAQNTSALTPLSTVDKVIIAHTGNVNDMCTDIDRCSAKVLSIQRFHMTTNHFDDIGYNFLVGGDGNVYEGRGFYQGAHTCGYNVGSICISLLGEFNENEVPERQLVATHNFYLYLVNTSGIITPDYKLFGQNQLRNFESPGINVYNEIQNWPRWTGEEMPNNCIKDILTV